MGAQLNIYRILIMWLLLEVVRKGERGIGAQNGIDMILMMTSLMNCLNLDLPMERTMLNHEEAGTFQLMVSQLLGTLYVTFFVSEYCSH